MELMHVTYVAYCVSYALGHCVESGLLLVIVDNEDFMLMHAHLMC